MYLVTISTYHHTIQSEFEVETGTIIQSDQWKARVALNEYAFTHITINHSGIFSELRKCIVYERAVTYHTII